MLELVKNRALSSISYDVGLFLSDCQLGNLSPNTLRIYKTALEDFVTWAGDPDTAAVTRQTLHQYFAHLQEQGHNPGGQQLAYRTLKTFFRWMVSEGEIEENPINGVRKPEVPEKYMDPVPLADIEAMLGVCVGRSFLALRDKALIRFLLDTAARASETVAVNRDDVALGDGSVLLRETKGSRDRFVFLGSEARKALRRYLRQRRDENPALWVTRSRERLAYHGLREILGRRSRETGLSREWSPHAFRRSFALLSLISGIDAISLQRIMGHRDISTTLRYVKQGRDDLREAHATHSPVDKLIGKGGR